MKNALILFAIAAGLATTASATLIYGAGDDSNLYSINITGSTVGATQEIGALGVTLFDIAEYSGKLYGIDGTSNLYSINLATGHATEIGATGQVFNALTFGSNGTLYAAGTGTTDMYTINTTTGAATKIAGETTQAAYNSAGDLQFIGSTLYLITQVGTTANSILNTVNLATGAITPVGTNIGSSNVYGLAASGNDSGTLYAFTNPTTGAGQVLTIALTGGTGTIGVGTNIGTYGGTGRGSFAFDGTTNDAVPEPATFGVISLGLAGLAGLAYRRRKV